MATVVLKLVEMLSVGWGGNGPMEGKGVGGRKGKGPVGPCQGESKEGETSLTVLLRLWNQILGHVLWFYFTRSVSFERPA